MLQATLSLTERVDARRREANLRLNPKTKVAQGQFMTPRPIAHCMASLFDTHRCGPVHVLDAGAGVGSLTAAVVDALLRRDDAVPSIAVTAYETDALLAAYVRDTLADCATSCADLGIAFASHLIMDDFIAAGADQLFLGGTPHLFTHAILNPPYQKIHSGSLHRRLLRSIGVETTNLYAGFLAVAIKLLEPGGELVTITPRSFCNGPYFKPFRDLLLDSMALRHIHVFESRTHAFQDDDVLQENIILYAVKGAPQGEVVLSVSPDTDLAHMHCRTVDFAQIVNPADGERFIHIGVHAADQHYVERMQALPCTLTDIGIDASTGPVVDFRLEPYLRDEPSSGTFPLIYPVHCRDHFVSWPLAGSRKPNAIRNAAAVQKWLYPNGHYVLIRRFSSKEERRRVVATVHDPRQVPGAQIGFENHLNVLHQHRQGLSPELARGLAVYLNSTLYDVCFRQFNGHTQVNVKDLYALRYPTRAILETWGRRVVDAAFPTQDVIDAWVEQDLS